MRRVALAVCLAVPTLAAGCFHNDAEADEETIALAKRAYERTKARGVDANRGRERQPRRQHRSRRLWVADVAHDPRQDVDDEPENQCQAYREGEADHFVELDPEGDFIRSG